MTENMKVAGAYTLLLTVIVAWSYGFVHFMEAAKKEALCLRYSDTMAAYEECTK